MLFKELLLPRCQKKRPLKDLSRKDLTAAKKKETNGGEGMIAVLKALKLLTDKVDTIDTQLQQNTIIVIHHNESD